MILYRDLLTELNTQRNKILNILGRRLKFLHNKEAKDIIDNTETEIKIERSSF